jgi:hypothetical protein
MNFMLEWVKFLKPFFSSLTACLNSKFFLHVLRGLKGLSKVGTSLNFYDSFKSTKNTLVSLISPSFLPSRANLSITFDGIRGAK